MLDFDKFTNYSQGDNIKCKQFDEFVSEFTNGTRTYYACDD